DHRASVGGTIRSSASASAVLELIVTFVIVIVIIVTVEPGARPGREFGIDGLRKVVAALDRRGGRFADRVGPRRRGGGVDRRRAIRTSHRLSEQRIRHTQSAPARRTGDLNRHARNTNGSKATPPPLRQTSSPDHVSPLFVRGREFL